MYAERLEIEKQNGINFQITGDQELAGFPASSG